MSFLRHDEIYRSDVGGKTILSLKPSRASRWSAPTQNKGRGSDPAPFPSSAMSLGSAIPWRVALQQSPPPLYRPESILQPPAETVNHHLTGAEEFSTGDLGNFQPALTIGRQCDWVDNHPGGTEGAFHCNLPELQQAKIRFEGQRVIGEERRRVYD